MGLFYEQNRNRSARIQIWHDDGWGAKKTDVSNNIDEISIEGPSSLANGLF